MKAKDTDEDSQLAFDRAIGSYIRSRKEKVPAFVAKYFSFKGALQLNKKAFGADLYKVPLNVTWSIPYLGLKVSSAIAHQIAVSNFILGPTVGGFYYTVFPAAASTTLIAASTGAVVMALAVLTSFSGIVMDPVQSRLGVHKRRLLRLIDSLEGQLRGNDNSRLKMRDQYYARIFDLLDLLKKASRTFI
jgi:hypothetical protein